MDHAALIDRFYHAYASRDAQHAASLYHPEGWHEEVAMAKRREGCEALAEGLVGFWRMLPQMLRGSGAAMLAAANHIAVPYRMTGTFTPRGEDAIPRAIALDGLHIFEIREGLFAGTKDMWDLDVFKAQMG